MVHNLSNEVNRSSLVSLLNQQALLFLFICTLGEDRQVLPRTYTDPEC